MKGKAVFDIETLFVRLLVVGQQRGVEVTNISQDDLSPVHPSLIDEFGCLRNGDKTVLVMCRGVPVNNAPAPDVVLVDACQLLYHVVWPGTAGDLPLSFGVRLSRYPPEAPKLVLVTTLTCSSCPSTGQAGILSGRISRWRIGTYAQQLTRRGTSVANCSA